MKKIFTFLSALLIGGAAFAQIPNAGFENWTSVSNYMNPDGWQTVDSLASAFGVSPLPCQQGTPGDPGSYFIKLVSQTSLLGVIPGAAISGTADFTTLTPLSGFPITTRPQTLTGNWQYMAMSSDQGQVGVLLTKWNATNNNRDTIAYVDNKLSGMQMTWAAFNIDLTYLAGANPDTGFIVLTSGKFGSGGAAGSYLYIDNLAFTGNVPAAVKSVSTLEGINVFPNPASTNVTVKGNANTDNLSIQVMDITGRVISITKADKVNGAFQQGIDLSNIPRGMYMLRVCDGIGTEVKKIVLQ